MIRLKSECWPKENLCLGRSLWMWQIPNKKMCVLELIPSDAVKHLAIKQAVQQCDVHVIYRPKINRRQRMRCREETRPRNQQQAKWTKTNRWNETLDERLLEKSDRVLANETPYQRCYKAPATVPEQGQHTHNIKQERKAAVSAGRRGSECDSSGWRASGRRGRSAARRFADDVDRSGVESSPLRYVHPTKAHKFWKRLKTSTYGVLEESIASLDAMKPEDAYRAPV